MYYSFSCTHRLVDVLQMCNTFEPSDSVSAVIKLLLGMNFTDTPLINTYVDEAHDTPNCASNSGTALPFHVQFMTYVSPILQDQQTICLLPSQYKYAYTKDITSINQNIKKLQKNFIGKYIQTINKQNYC